MNNESDVLIAWYRERGEDAVFEVAYNGAPPAVGSTVVIYRTAPGNTQAERLIGEVISCILTVHMIERAGGVPFVKARHEVACLDK